MFQMLFHPDFNTRQFEDLEKKKPRTPMAQRERLFNSPDKGKNNELILQNFLDFVMDG